ncbi:hypothetical protein MmiAt1_17200 [Methanimicrococcus sp. At1]|uniref:AcrB/AcrD/AcrF family protein n=1 Tax=Methanimicrococcus hacksteinii TaxID=3028293 RepID=A0ABU3VRR0_9EURY|nr:AcrB/AcrD/AcrF family protein [Methanimicrococcus sp. At1]MDV0446107.1 hypothetical protein [Methanimicrococcus sp. At1]
MADNQPKLSDQQGLAMKIFDIIFIFALAFICVVTPVFLSGGVIVVGGGISDAIVWNAPGYFGTLLVILVFFIVILYHSVKNYDY